MSESSGGQARIVVGVDGSEESKHALRWAARQAGFTGATLEAVTGWEYPAFFGFAPTIPDGIDYGELAGRALIQSIDEVFGADPPAPAGDPGDCQAPRAGPGRCVGRGRAAGGGLPRVWRLGRRAARVGQHLLHSPRALSGHGHPASRPPSQITGWGTIQCG
jgi:hypothetical protein